MYELQSVASEDVGLSLAALGHIDNLVERSTDDKTLPGASVIVTRHGMVAYNKTFVANDRLHPIDRNTVYWIASLSKPVLAVAVLQLFDRGLVSLNDPVAMYLPELANLGVAEVDQDGKVRIVPPRRKLTIHHLLTMTGGLTDLTAPSGAKNDSERFVFQVMGDVGIVDGVAPSQVTIANLIQQYAHVPLAYHPGEVFNYANAGCTLLAAIVERLSGRSYDQYLEVEIFDPLGMAATTFFPGDQMDNFVAPLYLAHDEPFGKKGDIVTAPIVGGGGIAVSYDPQIPKRETWRFLHAGGGLFSTGEDCCRFALMLSSGGLTCPGVDKDKGFRLLSREALRLMTSNRIGSFYNPITDNKWGYMVTVQETIAPTRIYYGGEGAFGRRGISGPEFWTNPAADTVVVFMTNVWWSFDLGHIKQKVAQIVNFALRE